jgi:hypothetical protein
MFKITFIGGEYKGKECVFGVEMGVLLWNGNRRSEVRDWESVTRGYDCMYVWLYGCMVMINR